MKIHFQVLLPLLRSNSLDLRGRLLAPALVMLAALSQNIQLDPLVALSSSTIPSHTSTSLPTPSSLIPYTFPIHILSIPFYALVLLHTLLHILPSLLHFLLLNQPLDSGFFCSSYTFVHFVICALSATG